MEVYAEESVTLEGEMIVYIIVQARALLEWRGPLNNYTV